RPHAIETTEDVRTPLCIPTQHDLRITTRTKPMSLRLQIATDLCGVEDLSVVDDGAGIVLRRHRLNAMRYIDDRETASDQAHRRGTVVDVGPVTIRPPMRDGSCHPEETVAIDRPSVPVENARDPAHSSGPHRDLLESFALSRLQNPQEARRSVRRRRQAPRYPSPNESPPHDRPSHVQGRYDNYRSRRTSQG